MSNALQLTKFFNRVLKELIERALNRNSESLNNQYSILFLRHKLTKLSWLEYTKYFRISLCFMEILDEVCCSFKLKRHSSRELFAGSPGTNYVLSQSLSGSFYEMY